MKNLVLFLTALLMTTTPFAAEHEVNLTVAYKTVNMTGKSTKAMAVNNQIPAPTLHFQQGDNVTINVHNNLDEETAIHWHGLLVPWQMDGVLGINQQGIKPGQTFHYQFTLEQAGTYWYHAHAGLQEQQGLYGAFIIDPPHKPTYQYNKDYAIILSDWSNTHPNTILANLKKTGDYYAPNFPLQASLSKFIRDYRKANCTERKLLIDDYKMMQQMRMGIYDISDVAFDAFLLNGHSTKQPWTALVKKGDVVRLRFIGAAGDTIYQVKIPGSDMQLVHVQGNDIKPRTLKNITIAPGETYDVLVRVQDDHPVIIYAEAKDKVGYAIGALITSENQLVNYNAVIPFPEPLPVTREMMSGMDDMQDMSSMQHEHGGHDMGSMSNMQMATESTIFGDHIIHAHEHVMDDIVTQGTTYQELKAAHKTNDPRTPIDGIINMELFGYMGRFIWFINGAPEDKAKPIILAPNKRYRIKFSNTSMMHHPMHIHGHWFILRNGHGAYDPLLHTINVPPGATVVADIDTDASGQWIFHCHLLYHMMSGMARTFQYSTLIAITKNEAKPQHVIKKTAYINRPIVRVDEVMPLDKKLVMHPSAHFHKMGFANFLDIGADPTQDMRKITFKGMYGYDYNKLQLFTNDAEIEKGTILNADLDIFYWHLLSQFWAIKGGINYVYLPENRYWQPGIGIEGLMPYFIDTNLRSYYYAGSAKLDAEFSRDTQITNNFFIRASLRGILASQTVPSAETGSGLNEMRYLIRPYYRIMPGLNIFAEYEYERSYGALKTINQGNNEPTKQHTMTIGLSVIF